MALFFMEQPDACHDRALDHHGVPHPSGTQAAGIAHYGNSRDVYVGGESDVYSHGRRRLWTFKDRSLSCGRGVCRSAVCRLRGAVCAAGKENRAAKIKESGAQGLATSKEYAEFILGQFSALAVFPPCHDRFLSVIIINRIFR